MDRICLHAAAVTKLRAISRELLSDAEMDALTAAPDLASFLEFARRCPLFAELPQGERSISEVRAYLKERFARSVISMEHFYPQEYKRFFRRVRDRFLIENMKNMARRQGVAALFDLAGTEMQSRGTDRDRLTENGCLTENGRLTENGCFLESGQRSENSLLAEAAYTARSLELLTEARVKSEMSLFQLEMFLDQNYFQRLAKAAKELNAGDRKVAEEIIGVDVDLQNLRWFVRAKRYYELDPSLIFNYALGAGKVYREAELQVLSRMNLDELTALIKASPYARVFEGNLDKGVLRLDAYLLKIIRRAKAENAMSLASFVDFLHEWEFQLRDLSTILEAKAYGLSPQSLLIRKITV